MGSTKKMVAQESEETLAQEASADASAPKERAVTLLLVAESGEERGFPSSSPEAAKRRQGKETNDHQPQSEGCQFFALGARHEQSKQHCPRAPNRHTHHLGNHLPRC